MLGIGRGTAKLPIALNAGVPNSRILQFSDVPSEMLALLAGRVDAVALAVASVNAMAATNDHVERANPRTQPVGADGKHILGYSSLAFRQADADLRDAYNLELEKLRDSGKLLDILKAYGYTENELPAVRVTAASLCR
ncbi:hypothetical protein ACE103_08845 [Bradyrhizobium sp. ma5]|uniref:hypothetical protein n=1 Tax=Bradyrhizobium sp. ma5 TaxID=3344828 RepID=UPI0035D433A3